jgi:hypothetical protein
MSQDYVKVYDAVDAAEAELLREALADAGIKAYIDNIPSPLDGLLAMARASPSWWTENSGARPCASSSNGPPGAGRPNRRPAAPTPSAARIRPTHNAV